MYEKLPLKGPHSHMSPEEIEKWYNTLEKEYESNLKQYEVKMPRKDTAKALWLIYLHKYMGKLVHKDTISAFVQSVKPEFGQDQQVRHLAADGWYILNKGDFLPNSTKTVESGYHLLVNTQAAKPSFIFKVLKRKGRLAAKDFEGLKAVYDNRCATCGSKEGRPHFHDKNKKTELQQGHMDPHKKLTLENTIPQCQLCNRTYKDYFVFDDKGRVIAIASPEPVRKASKDVQDKIRKMLEDD